MPQWQILPSAGRRTGLKNHFQNDAHIRDLLSQKGTDFKPPQLIRYADDFVILHEDITVVTRWEIISQWFKDMGLELKPSKHTYPYFK